MRAVASALLCCAALATSAHAAPGWTPAFDVAGPTFAVSDVVMGTDGTVVFTGTLYEGSAYHAAVRIRLPGGPLGAVQIVSQTNGSLAVAARADGSFFGAWLENTTVQTGILPAGGTAFGNPKPLPAAGTPNQTLYAAVDGQGNGWVAWTSTVASPGMSAASLHLGERPASGAATSRQTVESNGLQPNTDITIQNVDLAAAGDGHLMTRWKTTSNNVMASQTFNYARVALQPAGGTLGAAVTVDQTFTGDGVTIDAPDVAVNATGTAIALWPRVQAGTAALRARVGTTADGLAAGLENPVSGGGTGPSSPHVAMTTGGTIDATWLATVGGKLRVQRGTRGAGSWSAAQTITPATTNSISGYEPRPPRDDVLLLPLRIRRRRDCDPPRAPRPAAGEQALREALEGQREAPSLHAAQARRHAEALRRQRSERDRIQRPARHGRPPPRPIPRDAHGGRRGRQSLEAADAAVAHRRALSPRPPHGGGVAGRQAQDPDAGCSPHRPTRARSGR